MARNHAKGCQAGNAPWRSVAIEHQGDTCGWGTYSWSGYGKVSPRKPA